MLKFIFFVFFFGIVSTGNTDNTSNKSNVINVNEKSNSALGEIQFVWNDNMDISSRYHKMELSKNGRTFFTKLNTTSEKCEYLKGMTERAVFLNK